MMHRRNFLISSAIWFAGTTSLTRASVIRDHMPWAPYPSSAPRIERPGPWQFFTADEASAIEAIVDRIIPPDPQTPGGKEAGCAVFIDRQLKGPYGSGAGLYKLGPLHQGHKAAGAAIRGRRPPSSIARVSPRSTSIARRVSAAKTFAELSAEQQDDMLKQIEVGKIKFDGVDAQGFFSALLKDVPEGFFSDPIHGGNRDMVGWKMIGFPGIRYDYRDWVDRHNERYPLSARQHRRARRLDSSQT